jgi:hypothetical protein
MFLRKRPGEECQELRPRSDRGSLLVQTSLCIEAGLSRHLTCEILWAVDGSFISYKGIQGGLEQLWNLRGEDRQRNRGLFSDMIRVCRTLARARRT